MGGGGEKGDIVKGNIFNDPTLPNVCAFFMPSKIRSKPCESGINFLAIRSCLAGNNNSAAGPGIFRSHDSCSTLYL